MKKVAIVQSNYIPWKGYFDLIAAVDEFVLYDDVQFTKNDWRNRNRIKTPNHTEWLTVPVGQSINRRIRDVQIANFTWQAKHWKTLVTNYSKCPYFDEVSNWLKPIYLEEKFTYLSVLNRRLIETICIYLNINTVIKNSWDYKVGGGKVERLINLCIQTGGSEYISGPAAKDYISESAFEDKGIKITWFDYDGYTEYPQRWGSFVHNVTILDLLFNCGRNSSHYMKYSQQ